MGDRHGGSPPDNAPGRPPRRPPPGRVRTTSAASLAVAALLGALAGGSVPEIWERYGAVAPTVSWTAVLALAFLAAVLLGLAVATWRALHRRHQRIDPQRAVNLLVLGKASGLAGAVVTGGYLAYALVFAGETDVALPRERFVHGLLAALAGVAVVVGGLLLERACRVPGDPDGDRSGRDDEDHPPGGWRDPAPPH